MTYRRSMFLFVPVALCAAAVWASAADFSAWQKRQKLTFSGYERTETLADFAALVTFSEGAAGFHYTDFASPDGLDLRFSDGSRGVELPYEIEHWDTAGVSRVWVLLPQLAAGTNIWAYWGNSNATAREAYTTNGAVWSGRYRFVAHFQELFWRWQDAPHWKNSVHTNTAVGGYAGITHTSASPETTGP